MKTIKQVTIEPVFVDGYMPNICDMEYGKVYISEEYGISNHKCLCGCGIQTVLPINNGKDTFGWNLIKEKDGTISFTPSILNPKTILYSSADSTDEFVPTSWTDVYACHHYIITKNIANFV